MPEQTIEHFLSATVARQYALQHHSLPHVLPEIYASAATLYRHYSPKIVEAERFRADLATSLSKDPVAAKQLAERWASFLKTRAAAMESWSSLGAVLMATFGISSTLSTLVAVAAKAPFPLEMVLAFLAATALLLLFKIKVDARVFWFKFVSGHLEAIAKLGANPSYMDSPQNQET